MTDSDEELEQRYEEQIRQENIRQYNERVKAMQKSKATGHYTGRCGRCGSSNLWDDNLAYGCNSCGAIYV